MFSVEPIHDVCCCCCLCVTASQACLWAWELSTKVFGLPVERIWVSGGPGGSMCTVASSSSAAAAAAAAAATAGKGLVAAAQAEVAAGSTASEATVFGVPVERIWVSGGLSNLMPAVAAARATERLGSNSSSSSSSSSRSRSSSGSSTSNNSSISNNSSTSNSGDSNAYKAAATAAANLGSARLICVYCVLSAPPPPRCQCLRRMKRL